MKFLYTVILIYFSFSENLFSQTDYERWQKTETNYQMPNNFRHRDYSFDPDSPAKVLVKSLTNAYWFFVSDVDGDNCPFRPSCSSFFVQSIEETNIAQATLMFFDRFTRDLNIFKKGHYPRTEDGYFYDPPSLYSLEHPVEFIPSSEIVRPAYRQAGMNE